MHRTVKGLVLLALLVSVLAACGAQQPLGAKETADAFLKAIAGRDFAAAYKVLSPDSQASVSTQDFQQMLTKAWDDTKITDIKIKVVQEQVLTSSGTRASVPYAITMTTATGVTTDVYNSLSLVKVNGQWGVVWPPVR